MSSDNPKITSDDGRNNRLRAVSRAELRKHRLKMFAKGGPSKADLLETEIDGSPALVKDFGNKAWWVRLLGRIQISREVRAYRWLDGLSGVPALIGRIDAHALAMEKIEGEPLAFADNRYTEADGHMARIRQAVDDLHRAGVAHMDLRGRDNILVCPDGRIVIIDLAGAVCLRPGSLLHRIFFKWLILPDEAAFLKWKLLLTPDKLTGKEKIFLNRFAMTRKLWIFNPKRRKSGKGNG